MFHFLVTFLLINNLQLPVSSMYRAALEFIGVGVIDAISRKTRQIRTQTQLGSRPAVVVFT
jgi:hypothetical protein